MVLWEQDARKQGGEEPRREEAVGARCKETRREEASKQRARPVRGRQGREREGTARGKDGTDDGRRCAPVWEIHTATGKWRGGPGARKQEMVERRKEAEEKISNMVGEAEERKAWRERRKHGGREETSMGGQVET